MAGPGSKVIGTHYKIVLKVYDGQNEQRKNKMAAKMKFFFTLIKENQNASKTLNLEWFSQKSGEICKFKSGKVREFNNLTILTM